MALFFLVLILLLMLLGWIVFIYVMEWRLRTPENERFFIKVPGIEFVFPVVLFTNPDCPPELKRHYVETFVCFLAWEISLMLSIPNLGRAFGA